MTLNMIGSLIGGIGLFLLGMMLMTDGMKLAAGRALRQVLARSTRTPLRGILSGALITALVQASAMVTVAAIGFVNAGLMTLRQALTIIYGTNIGTTMTGWLVAAVGFDINIKVFALPAIGIGMFLRVMRSGRRSGHLGETLAGFGLFFLGLDVLKAAFGDLGENIQFTNFDGTGLLGLAAFVGAGFLLTVLMQSSSAALALVLTSAAGGVIGMTDAAAMVIGANVGTTVTALLVVLGATAAAKRVAAAHITFNLITGLVAVVILPLMLAGLESLRNLLGLAPNPATELALFHTAFNLLGVLLLWPFTSTLVRFLETRFRRGEEDEARPRYLDRTLTDTPVMALQALHKELDRLGQISRRMAREAISSEHGSPAVLERERAIIEHLVEATGEFSSRMQRSNLPQVLSEVLPNALRVSRYDSEIAELATLVATAQDKLEDLEHAELESEVSHFRGMVVNYLDEIDREGSAPEEERMTGLQQAYQVLKSRMLRAGTEGRVEVRQLVDHLDTLSNIRRMAEQADKAARYLGILSDYLSTDPTPEPALEEQSRE